MELIGLSYCDILFCFIETWKNGCNENRTHNHLIHKRKLKPTGLMIELYCEYFCMVQWIVYFYNVTYAFRVNLHSIIAWMSKNSLLEIFYTLELFYNLEEKVFKLKF